MTKSKPKKMNTGGLAKSQKSLKSWTKQDWRTKSGKPSTQGANEKARLRVSSLWLNLKKLQPK